VGREAGGSCSCCSHTSTLRLATAGHHGLYNSRIQPLLKTYSVHGSFIRSTCLPFLSIGSSAQMDLSHGGKSLWPFFLLCARAVLTRCTLRFQILKFFGFTEPVVYSRGLPCPPMQLLFTWKMARLIVEPRPLTRVRRSDREPGRIPSTAPSKPHDHFHGGCEPLIWKGLLHSGL
jgi:hypothetical protein